MALLAIPLAVFVLAGCGDDDDDDSQISKVRKELSILKQAEDAYYRQNQRYTSNLADLKQLQIDGRIAQSPSLEVGLSQPGQHREIYVSSNGKLALIGIRNADGGDESAVSLTLLKGTVYGEGCQSSTAGC